MAQERFIRGKVDASRHHGRASERRRMNEAEACLVDFLSGDCELYLTHGPEQQGKKLSDTQRLSEIKSPERGGTCLQSEDEQMGEIKDSFQRGDNAATTSEQGVVYLARFPR